MATQDCLLTVIQIKKYTPSMMKKMIIKIIILVVLFLNQTMDMRLLLEQGLIKMLNICEYIQLNTNLTMRIN